MTQKINMDSIKQSVDYFNKYGLYPKVLQFVRSGNEYNLKVVGIDDQTIEFIKNSNGSNAINYHFHPGAIEIVQSGNEYNLKVFGIGQQILEDIKNLNISDTIMCALGATNRSTIEAIQFDDVYYYNRIRALTINKGEAYSFDEIMSTLELNKGKYLKNHRDHLKDDPIDYDYSEKKIIKKDGNFYVGEELQKLEPGFYIESGLTFHHARVPMVFSKDLFYGVFKSANEYGSEDLDIHQDLEVAKITNLSDIIMCGLYRADPEFINLSNTYYNTVELKIIHKGNYYNSEEALEIGTSYFDTPKDLKLGIGSFYKSAEDMKLGKGIDYDYSGKIIMTNGAYFHVGEEIHELENGYYLEHGRHFFHESYFKDIAGLDSNIQGDLDA